MDFSARNRKAAINRWKKVHDKEKEKIKTDTKALVDKAAICGFIAGDGSLITRKAGNNTRYDLKFYPDDKEMLDKYIELIKHVYNKTPAVSWRDNMYDARLTSKVIVKDIIKLSKHGTHDWDVPSELFQHKGSKEAWLRAFFSAEAYVGPDHIKIQTVNKEGMDKISELLSELGIENRQYSYSPKKESHSDVFIIMINKKEARKRYLDRIGFWHSKKTEKLSKGHCLLIDTFK